MKAKKTSICNVRGCSRKIHGDGMCVTHYRREWRNKNPLKSSYQNLKTNANRRGKEFTITFEYFCKFAIKCQLILNRGRTAEAYTVDRIKDHLGYVPGNLQMLTKRENVIKQRRLEYDYRTKYGRVITSPDPLTENDAPY